MNLPRKNVNNLLFLPKTREYADDMYDALLKFVSSGKTAAVLTQSNSAPKLLPLLKKLGIAVHENKQVLQRLIFICCENLSAAMKKLFDLHDWTVKPNIIIIDLCTFVISGVSKTLSVAPLLHPLVQSIAVLFNMMNCIKNDESKQRLPIDQQLVYSVVVLQESDTALTSSQLELVTQLYYGGYTYDDFTNIIDVINLSETQ